MPATFQAAMTATANVPTAMKLGTVPILLVRARGWSVADVCPSCRGRVRGQICDGCGALIRPPPPCAHIRRSEPFDGAYRDRHGLVTWRRLAWCLDCDHIIPGPVVPMTAPTLEAQ